MIIATAGHIDHGKTALIRALTGVDTDRLPEEKRRGLTIDLGFAYLPTATGPTIGFVDVPGHERFIHNMLCGISGVDFVLLVVAADDGPMQQTTEHLAILDLLGVERGAVVVTKVDRVPPLRSADVTRQVRALLAPTLLADAPIFPVSSVTGEGIAELRAWLAHEAQQPNPRNSRGNFRLAVDRSFTKTGVGLIVTGTVRSGTIATGDAVRALLAGVRARVRFVHAQNADTERGHAGERCALNLTGTDVVRAEIKRGDWIIAGNVPPAVTRIDARLRIPKEEKRPLKHWTSMHVHLGAAHVTGRVALLQGKVLQAGESSLVELVLEQAIGAVRGDRFILRDISARRTIAGGTVIDVFPPLRGRAKAARIAYLEAMELEDDAAALAKLLDQAGSGLDLACFAANRNLDSKAAEHLFARVPMKRPPIIGGPVGFAVERWADLRAAMLAALAAWHHRSPDSAGIPEDRILQGMGIQVPRPMIGALALELAREGVIVREASVVRLRDHHPQLSANDAAVWQRVVPQLEAAALRPPTVVELATTLGLNPSGLETALLRIARHGDLIRVSNNRFFLPATVRRLAELAAAEAHAAGTITVAGFRDRSRIGRNLAIEVLEYFDRIELTRRNGDARQLVQPNQEGGIYCAAYPDAAIREPRAIGEPPRNQE